MQHCTIQRVVKWVSLLVVLGVTAITYLGAHHLASDRSNQSYLPLLMAAVVFLVLVVYIVWMSGRMSQLRVTEAHNKKQFDEALERARFESELVDENYKRLRAYLSSIPAVNSLLEAHLTYVNESTEKASLAIISRLYEVDKEISCLIEDIKTCRELSLEGRPSADQWHDLGQSATTVRMNVLEVLAHTQFQDISRQQIEVVNKGLTMASGLTQEVADLLEHSRGELLVPPNLTTETYAALCSCYTMEVQRQVHFQVTGDSSPLDKQEHPGIELF